LIRAEEVQARDRLGRVAVDSILDDTEFDRRVTVV